MVIVVAYCSQNPSRMKAKQSTVESPVQRGIRSVMSVLYWNLSLCRYDWIALATRYSLLKAFPVEWAQLAISARRARPSDPTRSVPCVYLARSPGG